MYSVIDFKRYKLNLFFFKINFTINIKSHSLQLRSKIYLHGAHAELQTRNSFTFDVVSPLNQVYCIEFSTFLQ